MRPTSRQRMQRLADELAAEELVEFIDNPRHRRSKLVRLTRKGDARYRKLSARFLAIASTIGDELSEADIRKTTEVVRSGASGSTDGHPVDCRTAQDRTAASSDQERRRSGATNDHLECVPRD
jgi:hypothetical protein